MYKLCKSEDSARRQRQIELELYEMMKAVHYDDITVTALCDRAGVPRKAFYRYFDSKEDALRAYIEHTLSEYDGFKDEHLTSGKRSLTGELEMYFDFWLKNKETLRVFDRSGLLPLLSECSVRFPVGDRVSTAKFLPDDTAVTRAWVFKFASAGMITLMLEWYKSGFCGSPRQMAQIAARIVSKPLFANLSEIGFDE